MDRPGNDGVGEVAVSTAGDEWQPVDVEAAAVGGHAPYHAPAPAAPRRPRRDQPREVGEGDAAVTPLQQGADPRVPGLGRNLVLIRGHQPVVRHYVDLLVFIICTFQTDVSQWTLLLLTLKCS